MKQPDEVGGAETQSCYIVVGDADAHYRKAKAAGAAILLDISDDDHGGRGYACRDPEGHIWSFGTYDPWQARALPRRQSTGLKRGLVMAAMLICATAAAFAGRMLPRSPTLSAEEIRLQQETMVTRQRAEQEEKRAALLAAELSQQRGAKDTAERTAREAQELLAREQGVKKTAEITTRQLEGQLATARRANDAAEQKAKEAGAQVAGERTARQTAERAASDATKELDRERDARQQAERSAQDAIEQLAREQRAKEDAERAAKQAREQLAQTQDGKSDVLTSKDAPARPSARERPTIAFGTVSRGRRTDRSFAVRSAASRHAGGRLPRPVDGRHHDRVADAGGHGAKPHPPRLLSLRLRHDPDIGLRRLPALRILLLGVVVAMTEPAMMTSSPCFQFTGVATLCLAVSCSESMTRSTSSKLRPVVIG